jgi:hypothetical protein
MPTLALLVLTLQLPAQATDPLPASLRAVNGFVENVGQWDERVLFFGRCGGIEATVFADGFLLRPVPLHDEVGEPIHAPAGVFAQFVGGEAEGGVQGHGPVETLHHYFLGSRRGSNARGFDFLRFDEIEPGVDLVLRAAATGFAYDVHVEAGAPFAGFGLDVHGASGLVLDGSGELSFVTEAGPVHHRFGPTYVSASAGGAPRPVAPEVRIESLARGERIWVDAPERSLDEALVIDPTLEFLSYLGVDFANETLIDLAVTPDGAKYVLLSGGAGMPTLPWSFATVGTKAWIGGLSPDGTTLFAATMLGGTDTDQALEIHLDPAGTITVVGSTWSDDFPITNNLAGTDGGVADIFVSRLSADCSILHWSTLIGGDDQDVAYAAAIFPNGDVAVAGRTKSTNVHATPGAFDEVLDPAPTFGVGPGDRLVLRLSNDGETVAAATWFFAFEIESLCATASGDLIISGSHGGSGQVPTTAEAAYPTLLDPDSLVGFVSRFRGDLSDLEWSTYLSDGASGDTAFNFTVAIDSTESVYFCSKATQFGHPTTPGAVEETNLFGCGWVGKLLPNATGFAWATYLAGSILQGTQDTSTITVDEAGNVSVAGTSNKDSWPVTDDAFQPEFVGPGSNADLGITRFDAVAETLDYSTWLGGNDSESKPKVAVGPEGRLVVGFASQSTNLPTTVGAYQTEHAAMNDAAVAVFDLGLHPWRLLGPGLKGSRETPNLVGLGALTPGSPARLALRGTEPNALVFWVGGFSEVNLPLLGGTLVPFPDAVIPAQAGPTGWLDLVFPRPNLAPGTLFTVQAWCLDPAAPQSFGASNGLRAIAQ